MDKDAQRKPKSWKCSTAIREAECFEKKPSEKVFPGTDSTQPKKSSLKKHQDKVNVGDLLKWRRRKHESGREGTEPEDRKKKRVRLIVSRKKISSMSNDRSTRMKLCDVDQKEPAIFLKKTEKTFNFDVGPDDVDTVVESTFYECSDTEEKQIFSKTEEIVMPNIGITPMENKYSIVNEKSIPRELTNDASDNGRTLDTEGEKKKKWKKHSGMKFDIGKKQTVNYFGKSDTRKRKFAESFYPYEVDSREIVECVDLEEMAEDDLRVKTYFRDVFIYVWYLLVITSVALWMVSWNMFYFKDVTTRLFMDTPNSPDGRNTSFKENSTNSTTEKRGKTLREAITIADFWTFAESTMITMFYWDFLNSHADLRLDDNKMLSDNQILGVPRLRQVRVRPDSCAIHPSMKRFFNECYAFYSVFAEETRPIKSGMEGSETATAWTYTEAEILGSSSYWGEISVYGGGGYYLDLAKTKNGTSQMVKELKENNWLSQATRALFIDFNLYNTNVNFFCLCKIVLEFPPFGGIIPRADFHPLKLIRYLDYWDFFFLGLEFLIVLYAVHYTIELMQLFSIQKLEFWFFFWNYIDLVIVALLYLYIVVACLLYRKVYVFVNNLSDRYYEYTEFHSVKVLQIFFNNMVAVLLFLSWSKMFKYLNCNVTMAEFYSTINKSTRGILTFIPMFLIMLLSFSIMGCLLFGNYVKDYSTTLSSLMALMQTFSGNFEYGQIREAHEILGPIFYLCFVFFMVFFAMNVFVAIVVEAYASIKSKISLDPPQMGEYFKRALYNFAKCCCCGFQGRFIKGKGVKKKLLYDEIRKMLRRSGFTDTEIRIFFYKYDINPSTIDNEGTKNRILRDLELNTIDVKENAEEYQMKCLIRRINELSDQMDEIEVSLQPVIDKVDILLRRQ